MKNYYDELEVSQKASKEVIEKAYKVLAKKYHPDSTTESDRVAAEERFKAISEAYNTLSDDFKRKEYDKELAESSPNISYEEYEYVLNKNKDLEDEIDYLHQRMNNTTASSGSGSSSRSSSGSKYFGDSPRGYYNRFTDSFVNPRASAGSSYTDRSDERYAHRTRPEDEYTNGKKPKRTFYYSDTGKPASAFDYYVYRIKTVGSNFFFGLLVFVAFLLLIRGVLTLSLSGNKKNNNNTTTPNETVQQPTQPEEYDPGYYDDDEDKELTNKALNSANPLQEIINFFNKKESK
jgi:curved DNA-binding protein CbpA